MSDQAQISPYKNENENEEKFLFGDNQLIQY